MQRKVFYLLYNAGYVPVESKDAARVHYTAILGGGVIMTKTGSQLVPLMEFDTPEAAIAHARRAMGAVGAVATLSYLVVEGISIVSRKQVEPPVEITYIDGHTPLRF